jgi:hypothetical protein
VEVVYRVELREAPYVLRHLIAVRLLGPLPNCVVFVRGLGVERGGVNDGGVDEVVGAVGRLRSCTSQLKSEKGGRPTGQPEHEALRAPHTCHHQRKSAHWPRQPPATPLLPAAKPRLSLQRDNGLRLLHMIQYVWVCGGGGGVVTIAFHNQPIVHCQWQPEYNSNLKGIRLDYD